MKSEQGIVGYHAIEEALKQAGSESILYVSQKNDRIAVLIKLASSRRIKIKRDSDDRLTKIGGTGHRGAVLVLKDSSRLAASGSPVNDISDFLRDLGTSRAMVLILDGITDPQNLGAILRSADQFGADLVVLPSRRSVKVNSTVLKTSSGAGMYVPVIEIPNLVRCIEELKRHEFWVYAAHIEGEPVWNCRFAERTALVLGAEGRGIGRLIGEKCDQYVRIPTMGHIDSLNVSVAAGIMLYEYHRQKISG
jgi:23S rRNA (guanosine2251-2'-O)-methyltransferase